MPDIEEILKEELGFLENDITKRIKDSGQVATGKTIQSFEHYLSAKNKGELSGAMYSGTLERGRGPATGKGSGNSDFLANLKEWIQVRGLQYKDEADLERLAKFLKWWINKNGTKLFRSGKTIDIFTTPISDFTSRLSERISNAYTEDIENDIFKK